MGAVALSHEWSGDFQTVIGREARARILEKEGRLPDLAGGLRGGRQQRHRPVPSRFWADEVDMIGVEAAGAASLGNSGLTGVLHGCYQLSASGRARADP